MVQLETRPAHPPDTASARIENSGWGTYRSQAYLGLVYQKLRGSKGQLMVRAEE